MNLPQTTTDRLLAVADKVQFESEKWNQATWYQGLGLCTLWDYQGTGGECGTTFCIAGWAIVLTPKEQKLSNFYNGAGAQALGLDGRVADEIFMSTGCKDAVAMAELLRGLAKIPEEQRILDDPDVDRLLTKFNCAWNRRTERNVSDGQ